MIEPYYQDDMVRLYLGDCLTMPGWPWAHADVLCTDPPYGNNWRQGAARDSVARRNGRPSKRNGYAGIAGNQSTDIRDKALTVWGLSKPAVVFGDLLLAPPAGTRQVLVYRKPNDAGTKGTFAGYRRDIEAVYLIGPWPSGLNGDSSVLTSGARTVGNPVGLAARYGHPHAKPVDVMCDLIGRCPPGIVADPFCGTGSTLVAARMMGRRAIGVEVDEQYCDKAARRLTQLLLDKV